MGRDQKGRETILIWDVSKLDALNPKRQPELEARQMSDFNILALKFSPVDTERLVSCGKENIRFWRINKGYLPGQPVILNHHARSTVFTIFDYEFAFEDPSAAQQFGKIKRIFVASK